MTNKSEQEIFLIKETINNNSTSPPEINFASTERQSLNDANEIKIKDGRSVYCTYPIEANLRW